MAGRKVAGGSRARGRRKGPNNGLLGFLGGPAVWVAFLVVASLIAFYFNRSTVLGWAADLWRSIIVALGAGLAIIALALLVVLLVVWRRNARVFLRRWNRWVGAVLLLTAAWGFLALFHPDGTLMFVGLGGRVGWAIIGDSAASAAGRLTGLVLLALIFISPEMVWQAAKKLAVWKWRGLCLLGRLIVRPRPRGVPAPPAPIPGSGVRAEASAEDQPDAAAVERAVVEVPATGGAGGTDKGPAAVKKVSPEKYRSVVTVGGWQLPAIEILDRPTEIELSQADIERRARLIEEALGSYGVEGKVVQINVGPTVTQFGVEPGWDRKFKEVKAKDKDGRVRAETQEVSRTRVKVDRIAALANDLALALAAPSIRIEAPVPGKGVVGIELPNTTFGTVALRGVIETSVFQKMKARSSLAIGLGKGAGGEAIVGDLARMPHLLIAGATGSGKTACLNSIIACLLMHNSPDEVKFIMIDPKRVELVPFNPLPHLVAPAVVETDKAINALRWMAAEMDNRYRRFAEAGARNIEGYNKDKPTAGLMPYLVLVIDELADLMMAAGDEVEHNLCRLAQLARATGIHLIVATQRPSVDVVTGLIKANFPTRISFAVTSQVDSRTILDMVGAEKLLGRGDMLYMPTDASKPKRLQGSFLGDAEIERMVYFWANQKRPGTMPVDFDEAAPPAGGGVDDPMLEQARSLVADQSSISTSFLQRQLRIGYPRAARIAEILKAERKTSEDGGSPEDPSS